MSDPIHELENFDLEGPTMTPLAPSEVRRRGDRMRRRRNALAGVAAAAAVAVIATTGAFTSGALDGRDSAPPVDSPSPTPTLTEIPASFPIAANLSVTDRGADARVADDLAYCGDRPLAGVTPVDALSAEMAGGETSVRRTLLLFGSDRVAADAELALLDGAAACPTQVSEGPVDVIHQVLPASGDWPGRTIRTTYGPTDTSFAHVNRAGPALLLSTYYWMGQPDDGLVESRASLAPLITAMEQFGTPTQPTADPAPTQPTVPESDEIPDGFPLDTDHRDLTGDGGELLGPAPDVRGLEDRKVCGSHLWSEAATDRLAFASTGPEYTDIRELRTFASADDAVAQMAAIRAMVGGCDRDILEGGAEITWTTYDEKTGYDSVTIGSTIEGSLGGDLFQVTRVGRAVLAMVVGAEWSPETAPAGAAELTVLTGKITPEMCVFTEAGCGDEGLG